MHGFQNKFDEDIANCPYSSDWFKQRCNVVSLIADYYDQATFFRYTVTQEPVDGIILRILFFELFDSLYVLTEAINVDYDDRVESSQLDKVHQYNQDIAFVMYSNLENVPPFAPTAMKWLKAGLLCNLDNPVNK